MDSNTLQDAFWSVTGDPSSIHVEILESELDMSLDDIIPYIADRVADSVANGDTTMDTPFESLRDTIGDILSESGFDNACDDGWFAIRLAKAALGVD